MNDIFDTEFEGKEVELGDNKAVVGDEVNLMAKDPTLKKVLVGVGWDLNSFNADTVDLDASLILLDRENMTRVDEDFVFYNAPETCEGGIKHHGDSRTGAGDGDDEAVTIDLAAVPFDVIKILIVLSIYKGIEKEQNLDMVRNAYARIVNDESTHEIVRYDMDKDLDDRKETAIIVGSLNREGPKWHFTPLAEYVEGGLRAVAERYGLIIGQE